MQSFSKPALVSSSFTRIFLKQNIRAVQSVQTSQTFCTVPVAEADNGIQGAVDKEALPDAFIEAASPDQEDAVEPQESCILYVLQVSHRHRDYWLPDQHPPIPHNPGFGIRILCSS